MLGICLLLLGSALAADATQDLAWDIRYQGKPVGERTLRVKYVESDGTTRRVLEGRTSLDGREAGLPYTYEQRLTATADRQPASFFSAISDNGEAREIQGRLAGGRWLVSIVDGGRARSWELPATELDLSTADLVDPGTRHPLSSFSTVRILSAETGDIWAQEVERLGPDTVEIDGEEVQVEGFRTDGPQGRSTFWYSSSGVLVRYAYRWLGRELDAVLRDPPPTGIDDQPIRVSPIDAVDSVEL